MALILSRFYGWERTCSADIHLPKNSRGMSLCLLADGSVFFYSLHKKIFYLASPDLFFFFAGFFCFASFFRLSFCSFSSSIFLNTFPHTVYFLFYYNSAKNPSLPVIAVDRIYTNVTVNGVNSNIRTAGKNGIYRFYSL